MTPQRWKISSKKEERSSSFFFPLFSSSLVSLYDVCSIQTFLVCSCSGLRAATSTSFIRNHNEVVEEPVGSGLLPPAWHCSLPASHRRRPAPRLSPPSARRWHYPPSRWMRRRRLTYFSFSSSLSVGPDRYVDCFFIASPRFDCCIDACLTQQPPSPPPFLFPWLVDCQRTSRGMSRRSQTSPICLSPSSSTDPDSKLLVFHASTG